MDIKMAGYILWIFKAWGCVPKAYTIQLYLTCSFQDPFKEIIFASIGIITMPLMTEHNFPILLLAAFPPAPQGWGDQCQVIGIASPDH